MRVEHHSLWKDSGDYKEPIDSDNVRVVRLEVDNATTYIDKDGSNNLTLTDANAGTVTLSDLADGTNAVKVIILKLVDDDTALGTGDNAGKAEFPIPQEFNGANLIDAHAFVSTVSSSGTPTYMVHNLTQTADMLSTAITIDENEKASYTADTQPVVDTGNDDVATGDVIRIDKDVAGTGEKGDTIILTFQIP